MSTDQSCGTCRHYAKHSKNAWGFCHWYEGRDIPCCLESLNCWDVCRVYGRQCTTWQAKETQDE